MKKTLLLTLFVAMAAGVFAQSQRMVLLEHFTSASCAPCAAANPNIETYFNNTSSNVMSIKYQGNFSFDPMETAEANTRFAYYGGGGVPNSVIDGIFNDHPNTYFAGGVSSTMDTRAGVMSDFDITVVSQLSNDLSSVDVSGIITASNTVANANLVAHVVVIEKHISFTSPPGSNGETDFYNVMKKMLPSSAGQTLQTTWSNGTTVILSESWNMSNVYNIGELAVVVFIQDDATKEILQAGFANVDLPSNIQTADLAATSSFAGSADLCDNAYTPSVIVTNNSSSSLDSVEVSYTVNNVPGGTQMIALGANANQTVTFPGITVAFGDEVVYTTSIQDYGVIDLSSINNSVIIDNFIILDSGFDNGAALNVTMDSSPDYAPSVPGAIDNNPDDIAAFTISSTGVNGLNTNLGGNGNSDGCFMWDFYSIQQGGSSLIFEEIDLTGGVLHTLSFTYAYAQYSNENDQLIISASNDCGNTWVELFNESGTDLATRSAVGNNTRFFPTATEWEDKTVTLSMFDGQSDIIIKVEGISDYGNSLYIDDIKTESFPVSTETEELEASLNVYPNPAVSDFNVSFEINEATDMNITLVNGIGQTIRTISNETFTAGEHLINVNTADLAAGTYFVNIRSEEGVTSKTITVIK